MKTHFSFSVSSFLILALAFAGSAGANPFTDAEVTHNFTSGTSHAAGGIELRLGGLIIAKGTFGSSPTLVAGDQGAGTRLLWHPRKAAFRAGYAAGNEWNEANIGTYSTAFGTGTTASGDSSFAAGAGSTASGYVSVALGGYSTASGGNCVALGGGQASFGNSIALGSSQATFANAISVGFGSTASGYGSVAFAQGTASGYHSIALGYFNTATGMWSLAMGSNTAAVGESSASLNSETMALGDMSTSMGLSTSAEAYASVAIGKYNLGGGSASSWVSSDPVFEIGNGTSTTPSNALTVYKNGELDVQGGINAGGAITCAPAGDIPMYGE